jgi:protein arginine kinase activator
MKCERCDDKAVFRVTDIADDGTVSEAHLCLKHLNKHLAADAAASPALANLDEGETVPPPAAAAPCPHCGMTFADFREAGRLGCAHDYRAFETELRALLESVHGAQAHQGKAPRQGAANAHRIAEIGKLRRALRQAVAREDYEAAARLRDQLDRLDRPAPAAAPGDDD